MRTVKLALLAVMLMLAGCSSTMNVQSDYDREVSFDNLDSYIWVEGIREYEDQGRLGFDSEIMARRIRDMVHAELANRGYVRKESDLAQADFAISYRMLATEEVDQLGHGGHGGHGGRGGHRVYGGHGYGGTSAYTRDVVRCILMLDVHDPATNQLIWRGWVRWQMDEEPSPEDVTQRLGQAVEEILSAFPPGRVSTAARQPRP